MIIIMEGPDGSGKTTLAEQLSRQTGYEIIHRTKPANEEEKKAMHLMYLKTIAKNKNVIFDRCWYSEMAYGPVMRDDSVITYPQMYELEKALAKKGAMIIYCTGNRDEMWKRATSRGEDYITSPTDYINICNNYDELFSVPHLIPVTRYRIEN